MREIEQGLCVDLSKVEAVEKDGNSVILHISGKSFPWNVSYGTALQLIEINNRSNSSVAIP